MKSTSGLKALNGDFSYDRFRELVLSIGETENPTKAFRVLWTRCTGPKALMLMFPKDESAWSAK